jgi:hypothetical protein
MPCKELYPDIFTPLPDTEDKTILDPIRADNAARKKLYLAVRKLLRDQYSFDPDKSTTPEPEQFPGGFGKRGPHGKVWDELLLEEKIFFSAVYGQLLAGNYLDPSLGRQDYGTTGPTDIFFREAHVDVLMVDRFIEAVTDAVKFYNANRQLFRIVYQELIRAGAPSFDADGNPTETTVYTRQLADVTTRLVNDRADPANPQIRLLVINALSQALGGVVDGNVSGIDIRLPDLDAGTAVEIVADNVRAVAAIYFSAMLEDWKLYAATEKVVEHFVSGMLPVSRGPAGERIYDWMKGASQRITEAERRGVYGRVLGLAQGNVQEGLPNREFSDLWVRFLSTVSMLSRDSDSQQTKKVVAQQAHKSARDLAVNLSLHGYGVAHFAAVEMQDLIKRMKALMSSPELLRAYGVNDAWQMVERVSAMHLGGARNGVRYRTMAQTGANIMLWLANRAPLLASVASGTVGRVDFQDTTLVENVEQWLAVTGTPDATVEKYTDPVDLQAQPTIPNIVSGSIGQQVRNVLDNVGVNLPGMPSA